MWTMFCWTAKPSRTWATSRRSTGAPFTTFTGMALNCSTVVGLELSLTLYSVLPICAVPAGTMTLDCRSAVTTSLGLSPLAEVALGSTSTMICRCLPP